MSFSTSTPRRFADPARRDTAPSSAGRISTGIPFWDMMLSFGQVASQQAMSGFAGNVPTTDQGDRKPVRAPGDVEVIALGEETLHVGKRVVAGETTRVRRVVVETPVEQSVSLRQERVIVERRKPTPASAATTQGLLTGAAVEMSDSFEVVDSWKSARVTEEVVLRREVTMHTETVRATVRHDEVVIEQAGKPALPPASPQAAAFERVARADRAPMPAEVKPAAGRADATPQPNDRIAASVRAEAEAFKAEVAMPMPAPKAEPPKPVFAEAKSTAPTATPEADRNDKSGQPRKV